MGLFVFVLLFIGIFGKSFFMPLTPNFTATQYISTPNLIVFDDTSTGSDAGITVRRVYMQKSDGTYLVEDGTTTDYEVWTLAEGNTVSFDVLNKDYALNITVEWLQNTTVLYSKTVSYCFSTYSKIYNTKLSKAQVSSPKLLDGDNWLSTKFALNTYIRAADDAISLGAGITIAQLSLNKAKFIIDNPKLVF
jgi:hypothetical protein